MSGISIVSQLEIRFSSLKRAERKHKNEPGIPHTRFTKMLYAYLYLVVPIAVKLLLIYLLQESNTMGCVPSVK